MTNQNKNKNESNGKTFSNEFWKQAQDYGKEIGCEIPDKPYGWLHKVNVFSNAKMLDVYLNTFMKSEEYIGANFKSTCGKDSAMRAISAIHKAKTEVRSFFFGIGIGVISFGISLVSYFLSVRNTDEFILASYMLLIYIFFCIVILVIPYYQNKNSIISSAINDVVEQFEKECQNNNIKPSNNIKTNKSCKKYREISLWQLK